MYVSSNAIHRCNTRKENDAVLKKKPETFQMKICCIGVFSHQQSADYQRLYLLLYPANIVPIPQVIAYRRQLLGCNRQMIIVRHDQNPAGKCNWQILIDYHLSLIILFHFDIIFECLQRIQGQ